MKHGIYMVAAAILLAAPGVGARAASVEISGTQSLPGVIPASGHLPPIEIDPSARFMPEPLAASISVDPGDLPTGTSVFAEFMHQCDAPMVKGDDPANAPTSFTATFQLASHTLAHVNHYDYLNSTAIPTEFNGEYAVVGTFFNRARASLPRDSALDEPGTVIPLPAAAWTGMSLLAGLGVLRIMRSRRRPEV